MFYNKFKNQIINNVMKKVCIVFGGLSSEHDISIITGMQLSKNIESFFTLEKIYIGLDNKFHLATKVKDISFFENKNEIKLKEVYFSNNAIFQSGLFKNKICDIDCVVNCCHGGIGENGDLAGFFATLGIRCTSAGSLASHIAMDKSLTKELVKDIVPTIKGVKITKENLKQAKHKIGKKLSADLIVKPNSLGSSIGVKICNKKNYIKQVKAIFEMQDEALVEERVVNIKEYNQACYKTKDGLVMSAIEQPLTKSTFLTFEDKYKGSGKQKGRDRVIPAEISTELENQIIEYTSKIYEKLNMNGVVRIDYIFDADKSKLYFNEINTIPGSMAFYLFEPIGIDYVTLISQLVENAPDLKKFTYFDTQILKDKKI